MTPALEAVRRVQGWRAGVVVEEPFAPVFKDNPYVDELLVLRAAKRKWRARATLIRHLRNLTADLVIDLHGGTTASLITRMSAARLRVGFGGRNKGAYDLALRDSREVWEKEEVHTVEHQLSPLKELGFPVSPIPPPRAALDAGRSRAMGALLSEKGVEGDFLLVHLAAAFDTKQWPAERFAEAVAVLSREMRVVATVGPGQEPILHRFAAAAGEAALCLPPLDLADFTALTSLCRLYLGNDTGPTHLAAALEKPIVVLFGSSDWKVWRPWGVQHRLLKADLPCIPCPGYTCPLYDEPKCILSIPVSEVIEAVRSLL